MEEANFFLQHPKPKKVLFDHLPKCGGTTITYYIRSNYPAKKVFRIDGSQPTASVKTFQSFPKRVRYRYYCVYGHFADQLMKLVHPETIAVTVFRDPVDRIISHYFYVKRRKDHYLHNDVISGKIKLEDYASSELSVELSNWLTAHFSGLSNEEVLKNPEEALDLALHHIANRYELIGFLDHIDIFINHLKVIAGFRKNFTNKKLNMSKNRIHFNQIPTTTKEIIAENNYLDILLYKKLRQEYLQV